jgi:hypothetical protein
MSKSAPFIRATNPITKNMYGRISWNIG